MATRIFIQGQTVVPSSMNDGQVIFEDVNGNPAWANEQQCNAYGYIWDKDSNTCKAYDQSLRVTSIGQETSNINKGASNQWRPPVSSSICTGQNNLFIGKNTSVNVIGDNNQVNENTKNALMIGVSAESYVDNSITLGGNYPKINPKNEARQILYGEKQMMYFQYSVTSTSNGTIASFLNGIPANFFIVPQKSGMYFHCDVVALRTGGISKLGAIGDMGSWTERGVMRRGTGGEGSVALARERDTVQSIGTGTGNWRPTANINSSGIFGVDVRGDRDMTIEWLISIRITQIKTLSNI